MKKIFLASVALACLCSPAFAQNRFMDQARESEDRRKEHQAIREAENPEPAKSAPAVSADTTPAEPAPVAAAPPATAPAGQ